MRDMWHVGEKDIVGSGPMGMIGVARKKAA
jgi:hypothetical protein